MTQAKRISGFVLCASVALAVYYAIVFLIPRQLATQTPVVGFPIHANFNINLLFWQLYLPFFLLPTISYVLFMRWYGDGPGLLRGEPLRVPAHAGRIGQLCRRALLGATLALPLVPLAGASPAAALAAGALGYALLREAFPHPGIDAILASLSPLVLCAFSARTAMVLPGGALEPVSWWPWSLAILSSALCLVLVAWRGPAKIEARFAPAAAWVVISVLAVGSLPGPSGTSDLFHDGETLASAKLLLSGRFPWRDLLFIHGLLEDPLRTVFGFLAFDRSIWGANAGCGLILWPLYFAFYALLYGTLFRRNFAWALCTVILLRTCGGFFFSWPIAQLRLLFYPMVVLALLAVFLKPSWWRSLCFASVLFVQVVLTPESTYLLPAFTIPIFVSDLMRRDFTRTWRVGVGLVGCGAILMGFLARHRAVEPFFGYYRIFAEGHRYTGGIPFRPSNENMVLLAYIPTLAIFCFFWSLALRRYRGRRWSELDWTMIGVSLFVLFYYQKFVSRADSHVAQPYAMAMPLYFYLIARLLRRLDRHVRNRWPLLLRPVSVCLAVAYVVASPAHLRQEVSALATKWRVTVPPGMPSGQEKFLAVNGELRGLLADFHAFFDRYLEPNERIFDFTNQPEFFFYFLNRQPATRYFHVSMAIGPTAQRDLVDELEKEKPRLVIFQAERGLGAWDGVPTMVRHYDVSRYLLTHYRPFAEMHGTLLMKRNDVDWPVTGPVSRTGYEECNWGTVPYFWRHPAHTDGKDGLPFTTHPYQGGFLTEIRVPAGKIGGRRLELELDRMTDDYLTLADRPEALEKPEARIALRGTALDTPAVYPLEVGSCYQWYRYQGDRLYLRSAKAPQIRSIRIVD